MQITGSYAFKFDKQSVWEILNNPDAIAKAIPGVKEMVPIEGEDNAWRATAKIGVASVSGTYSGTIHMTELTPPHSYRLTAQGEGQQSVISGTALMTLTYDEAKQQTIVAWDADAHLSGKLASIAQRLVKGAAALLSRQFFGGINKQLRKAKGLAEEEPAPMTTSATPEEA